MVRSSGFGSTTCYYTRPLQTRFRFGSGTSCLNLATHRNSPARSTKSTTSDWFPVVLCLLVSTRFQVLFHSPPGVLFTFPSRYYTLSVIRSYLALGDGPPSFPPNFSCSMVLWIFTRHHFNFNYAAFTLFGCAFQRSSSISVINFTWVRTLHIFLYEV